MIRDSSIPGFPAPHGDMFFGKTPNPTFDSSDASIGVLEITVAANLELYQEYIRL